MTRARLLASLCGHRDRCTAPYASVTALASRRRRRRSRRRPSGAHDETVRGVSHQAGPPRCPADTPPAPWVRRPPRYGPPPPRQNRSLAGEPAAQAARCGAGCGSWRCDTWPPGYRTRGAQRAELAVHRQGALRHAAVAAGDAQRPLGLGAGRLDEGGGEGGEAVGLLVGHPDEAGGGALAGRQQARLPVVPVEHPVGGGETDTGAGGALVSDRPVGAAQVDRRARRGGRNDPCRHGVLEGPVGVDAGGRLAVENEPSRPRPTRARAGLRPGSGATPWCCGRASCMQ